MNAVSRTVRRRKRAGFTLLEVLIALTLASIVLSVSLAELCGHVKRIARMEPRYNKLVLNSFLLDKVMDSKQTSSSTDTFRSQQYTVTVSTMQADARLDQVDVKVNTAGLGNEFVLTAYRWRSTNSNTTTTSYTDIRSSDPRLLAILGRKSSLKDVD